MLNSQWLSLISSLMFLSLFSSDRHVTATLYALRIQDKRVRLLSTERAAHYCCSTANYLQIELTQSHTQPGQPGYKMTATDDNEEENLTSMATFSAWS